MSENYIKKKGFVQFLDLQKESIIDSTSMVLGKVRATTSPGLMPAEISREAA
jgi:hypothetical protein